MSDADSPEKILQLKKGSGFYVTEDNIAHAQAARVAHQRIKAGNGSPEDYDLVNGRNEMLRKAVEESK